MADEKAKPEGGFLSRWSRLKANEVPPAAKSAPQVTQAFASNSPIVGEFEANAVEVPANRGVSDTPPAELPAIESLTSESDFTPFMAKDVSPAMRNLAMKKLFTDPHYNVMDRLDIYIDDYGQPDPIPPEMLRMLTQSKTLRLFDEDDPEEAAARSLRQQVVRDQEAGIIAQPPELDTVLAVPPDVADLAAESAAASTDVQKSDAFLPAETESETELIEVKVSGVSKP
jgi:hypothetical protein